MSRSGAGAFGPDGVLDRGVILPGLVAKGRVKGKRLASGDGCGI